MRVHFKGEALNDDEVDEMLREGKELFEITLKLTFAADVDNDGQINYVITHFLSNYQVEFIKMLVNSK